MKILDEFCPTVLEKRYKNSRFAYFYTNSFALFRESYALICEGYAWIRESYALIRERFAFIRESILFIHESIWIIIIEHFNKTLFRMNNMGFYYVNVTWKFLNFHLEIGYQIWLEVQIPRSL